MDNEVIKRHKKRWHEGETESEGLLNEAIENFNSLVNNLEAPSVHSVEFSIPLDYSIQDRKTDNILLSDISRQEQIRDIKLMHVKLDSDINAGSYVFWDGTPWITLNKEHNAVKSHKTYTIQKCGVDVNIMLDGTTYTYPVALTNLTLYSDGISELVNLSVSSAKYSMQIAENEVTNTIDIGTRFIIRGRAFEVSLIDDFTIQNVRTFTICETVTNSLDDTEFDIAHNENSDLEDGINPNLEIMGNDIILIGDTVEYTLPNAKSWELEANEALTVISNEKGICKIKCKSSSSFIGQVVKLKALNNLGKVIDEKEIRIGGLF